MVEELVFTKQPFKAFFKGTFSSTDTTITFTTTHASTDGNTWQSVNQSTRGPYNYTLSENTLTLEGVEFTKQAQQQIPQTQTPSFESVIVASSSANANSLIQATTFPRGTGIVLGIKNAINCNQSGIKFRFSLYKNSTFISVLEQGTMPSAPSASFTGKMTEIQGYLVGMSPLVVGTDYSFEFCFIDSNGNPFNVKRTNTFSITN